MSDSVYVGLMSGTSLDGVDAVLAVFDPSGTPRILSTAALPFTTSLRDELLALNSPGHNELTRAALAANELASLYAKVTVQVLNSAGRSAKDVNAIGVHGQTVRHQPALGYTLQLNSPALLAELTGIKVIADFRSRDVAAQGQGAPLVPMFHRHVFACKGITRVVLNLGGIANISILKSNCDLLGFDTGPANVLMDLWCRLHTDNHYDDGGAWGLTGTVDSALLSHLIDSEPWFKLAAPKSTGRDLFHHEWLNLRLAPFNIQPQDTQATLRALTAETVSRAILSEAPDVDEVLVCGGGAKNPALLQELKERLPCLVRTTESLGVPSQDVEALAFAWLAWANDHDIKASSPAVTGAKGARILGAVWKA